MNKFRTIYALRWQVLERDNFTCQYCGQHAPNVQLEVDHVIPVSEGGDNSLDNLKTSCYACNRGKSGLSIIRKRRGTVNKTRIIAPARDSMMRLVTSNQEITAKYIAERLNIKTAHARILIHRALKHNLLKRTKVGRYILNQ